MTAADLARLAIEKDKERACGPWSVCLAPDEGSMRCGIADHNFEFVARTDIPSLFDTATCEANAAFIAFAENHLADLARAVLAMDPLVEWAKRWRTETCSRVNGCDTYDGRHGAECEITRNEREGCSLVDALTKESP